MAEISRRSRGYFGSLPPLAIDSNKKTEAYYEDVMNCLEHIATSQYIRNLKYVDMFRMVEGKQSVKEVQEFLPFLKNLSPHQVESAIPTYIRHYDLYGQIVNSVVENYMLTRDDFAIQAIDPLSTNEVLRTKDLLMQRSIREGFQNELIETLQAEGYETDLTLMNFEDEEEELAYQDFLAKRSEELTPDAINTYMQDGYKLSAIKWADITLRNDFKRFKEESMVRDNTTDFMVTGKAFRRMFVNYDSYESQVWRTQEVFHSEEANLKFVNKGEFVGRTTLMTLSQILSAYGSIIPTSIINKVSNREEIVGGVNGLLPPDLTQPWTDKIPELYPSPDYLERETLRNIENTFRVPLTTLTGESGCGPMTTKGFASGRFGHGLSGSLYPYMRDVLGYNLRQDVYQVTEAYFRDWQKTGLICFENEFGTLAFEFVTDDILKSFLSDFDIKQVKTKSLKEMKENPEPNTITWFFTPYSRYGIKINFELKGGNSFYMTEKTPYQIQGNSEMFEVCHPVVGIIGDGLGDKLENYQAMFNLNMNQLQEMSEKEVGVFFLFDQAFLGSDQKDMGQSDEAIELAMQVAKSLGYLSIDTSNTTFSEAIASGQFHPINMSLGGLMQQRLQNALFYQQQAYNLIGVRVGQGAPPDSYKTAEGVKTDKEAQYAQLEHYYSQLSDFFGEVYTTQLAIAQYCQRNGKDVSALYVHNDGTQNFIQFSDPNFSLRKFGVYPLSNAKERKQKETVAQYLLSNNTINQDLISGIQILTSNSVGDMISSAREARVRQESQMQQAQQIQNQTIQASLEADKELAQFQWTLKEISNQRDRENALLVKGVDAMGRALYRNAGTENADVIANQVEQSLRETEITNEESYRTEKLAIDRTKAINASNRENRRLDQIDRQLDLSERKQNNDRFIATINKN